MLQGRSGEEAAEVLARVQSCAGTIAGPLWNVGKVGTLERGKVGREETDDVVVDQHLGVQIVEVKRTNELVDGRDSGEDSGHASWGAVQ